MTKQETYDYLRAHGVDFEITEHPAVFNMEECAAVDMPYPEDDAKNLLVRDAAGAAERPGPRCPLLPGPGFRRRPHRRSSQ